MGQHRDATFVAAILFAIALGFVAYVARLGDVTHDAFHEMALARAFVQSGEFPKNDLFAFTPTIAPAVHHEWGTGLFLYFVAGANPLGLHGMAVARLLLMSLLGLLLYRVARNNGAHPLFFALCAPVAFPLAWVGFATLRAQLLTLVFMAAQLLLQQSDWRGKRTWIIPWFALYLVWLNCHAGFIVGIAMLGLHVIERWLDHFSQRSSIRRPSDLVMRFWHHWLLIPMLGVGLLINPWGIDYPKYLWHAITMPRPTIFEWQPLWMMPDQLTTLLAFGAMVFGLGYAAKSRQWRRLRGWLFCCLAAYMALKHIRHGSLFAVAWLALVPGWLTPTPFGRSIIAWFYSFRSLAIKMAGVLAAASLIFAIGQTVWRVRLPDDDPNGVMVYPVGAIDYLQRISFQGNLMTPFAAGAYVSWRCYPDVRVSLDGRYEVAYRADVLPKHDEFYLAQGRWREILNEYDADAILVQQAAPIRKLLGKKETQTENYRLVYEDPAYAVFVQDELSVRSSESLNSLQKR